VPLTGWLPDAVHRDQWGFILTGPDTGQDWPLGRPFLLETTVPGVFAASDVRHGSVKRVASAVGDGSIAIRLVHEYRALASPVREGHEPRLQSRREADIGTEPAAAELQFCAGDLSGNRADLLQASIGLRGVRRDVPMAPGCRVRRSRPAVLLMERSVGRRGRLTGGQPTALAAGRNIQRSPV
jgi:hypothetical protein